jgi:hypothetical protein
MHAGPGATPFLGKPSVGFLGRAVCQNAAPAQLIAHCWRTGPSRQIRTVLYILFWQIPRQSGRQTMLIDLGGSLPACARVVLRWYTRQKKGWCSCMHCTVTERAPHWLTISESQVTMQRFGNLVGTAEYGSTRSWSNALVVDRRPSWQTGMSPPSPVSSLHGWVGWWSGVFVSFS